MSLFLAQTDGTNNFRFARAQTHIISIARMDTGQGFAAGTTVLEGVTCTEVTYTRTLTGPTSVRLDALVHDTGFTTPRQIVIMAVPDGVTFNGTPVSAIAGVAVPIGGPGNPFANRICAIYDADDCNGAGHWVDQDGGGTTSFPADVILYHELAHCFHFATGVASTEPLAETDENDMRDARGLPRRNTASHNGGCGGGPTGCCVVASLATGSSYSAEIRRFRHFREQVVRRSMVGDDFFREFHFRYYRVSPEVTRLMGKRPKLSPLIRDRFVLPLLAGVELLIHYTDQGGRGLGGFLLAQTRSEGLADVCGQTSLAEVSGYLSLVRRFDKETVATVARARGKAYPGLRQLLRYLSAETVTDEYIEWALLAVVELWVTSALRARAGAAEADLDRELQERIGAWMARMPVSSVWKEFSRLDTERELQDLERFMFDPQAKQAFADRLIDSHPHHAATVRAWAESKGGDHAGA